MRRAAALLFVIGCGSVPPSYTVEGDATTSDASDASPFSFDDAPPPAVDAPDVVLEGGGPFLCHGCICDGTKSYCYDLWVGAALDGGSEAGECPTDGGSACVPYTPDCLPNPTCACVLGHVCPGSQCAMDKSGNGLDVLCILP